MGINEAAMASVKVFDPVSVPFSILEELQQLRGQVERLRQENERLRRELQAARAGLEQAQRQSKRQAAPFSKGPSSRSRRGPAASPALPTAATAIARSPAPRRSMSASRRPCRRLAPGAVAPSGRPGSPPSIRRRSRDAP
jgi:TolA-binding protein